MRAPIVAIAAALALAGCAQVSPFEPREGAVEIPGTVLAEPQDFPHHLEGDWRANDGGIAVAADRDELERLWREPLDDDPLPARYLETSVIVAVGILEGGVCPLRVLAVDAKPPGNDIGVHLHNPRLSDEEDCGREFLPRTFVVALPIGALDGDELELTVVRPDGREETRSAALRPEP